MITIKINSRFVDFDDVSFKIKNENPALSDNFINDGYSYTLKLPKTARNRTIIRGDVLKISVSWKGFVFVQGNYVISDDTSNEVVGSIVTHGSVFRQNLEEKPLNSLSLAVVKICDALDIPSVKVNKWHAHMVANANENANKGTHKFPMIYSYGYWDKFYNVQPNENIVFNFSGNRTNAWMGGSYVKNSSFEGSEKQWTHTVSPCPKINYLVEEIIKSQGFILGDNFLEGIPEYEQMFCFNNYALDKVEVDGPGTSLNVHGLEIDLKKHVPNTNCWAVFEMLNEVFGINLVIEDKKIHIRKTIANLKKQPKNYSNLLNNDSRTTINENGLNLRYKYDVGEDSYKIYKDLGEPRLVKLNNEFKSEDKVLTHLPLAQSVYNSQGVLRNKQEYDDYANSLYEPYYWLGGQETKIELGSNSKLVSDEYPENGAEIFDHLRIGCFRGIYNTTSISFPDIVVIYVATIWCYNLRKILNPSLLANGINYDFGNSSIYISGPDNAFDFYRMEDLKILQGSKVKEVSYHLPMKTVLELQKWKDTKHIIQQKLSSFIGILSEIDMSLGVNGFSSETTIKYLVLNEDKNMNFYQQRSTSEMIEIPVSYEEEDLDIYLITENEEFVITENEEFLIVE